VKWHIADMESRESRMRNILELRFPGAEFGLENESSQHAVPAGSETHFKLLIVSNDFSGLSRIDRSRLVQSLFSEEFKSGLHALSIRAITQEEAAGGAKDGFVSPACMSRRKQ
jgi:stress-induced morphogen